LTHLNEDTFGKRLRRVPQWTFLLTMGAVAAGAAQLPVEDKRHVFPPTTGTLAVDHGSGTSAPHLD
jgi:hypothetical protein